MHVRMGREQSDTMLFITHIQQAVEARRTELAALHAERGRLDEELCAARQDVARLQEDIDVEEETMRALQDRWLGLCRDIDGLKENLPKLQDEYVDCLRHKERLTSLIQQTQEEMYATVAAFRKRVRDEADEDGPVAGRLRSTSNRKKSRVVAGGGDERPGADQPRQRAD